VAETIAFDINDAITGDSGTGVDAENSHKKPGEQQLE
jgi:hypothetical protein